MRNIFLEKSCTKCGRDTIARHSSKKSKLRYLWINSLKFYTVCCNCIPRYIKTGADHFYLIKSFFKKQKDVLN